jgi:hypothetical protein
MVIFYRTLQTSDRSPVHLPSCCQKCHHLMTQYMMPFTIGSLVVLYSNLNKANIFLQQGSTPGQWPPNFLKEKNILLLLVSVADLGFLCRILDAYPGPDFFPVLRILIRDLGSSAFLTPGSRMGKKSGPGSGMTT